jgi:putative ABC transport system permease protein
MNRPPRFSERFLNWFCPPVLLEEIQGDLEEQFQSDIKWMSTRSARWHYTKRVLSFFRPSIIFRNKFHFDFLHMSMLSSYFKISWRYLGKNPTFSAINIIGLALGIAAALLVYQFVSFQKTYDDFHENRSSIYRVTTEWNRTANNNDHRATTVPWSGPAVKEAFPEVINFTRLAPIDVFTGPNAVSYGNMKIEEQRIFLADTTFFQMFSFEFVKGNPEFALNDPGSVVVTESIARKYFKTEDPIGKILYINTHGNLGENKSDLYSVTAVVKDPPANSHLSFDFLLSFNLIYKGLHNGSTYWHWDYTYCYLQLHPKVDIGALEKKISALRVKQFGKDMQYYKDQIDFKLQPLADIHLTSELKNEIADVTDGSNLYFLMLIGICILFCGYINYVNLSTVKAIERKMEIGVRKVVGSSKGQLIVQLLVESFVLNSAALILGVILFYIGVPIIEALFNINWPSWTLSHFTWEFIVIALSVFLIGILLSTMYPAFVLARFKPAVVLKGGNLFSKDRNYSLRHVLIVVQFVFCIAFSVLTYSLYRQQQFMQQHSLGMSINDVLTVKGYGFQSYNVYETFQQKLASFPFVESVGTSTTAPGEEISDLSFNRTVSVAGKNSGEKKLKVVLVDENFFDVLKIEFVAGENFNRKTDKDVAIINDAAAAALGYNADDVLNERLTGLAQVDPKVIGVIKNYNQRSLKNDYDPMVFMVMRDNDYGWNKRYFYVRMNHHETGHLSENLTRIEDVWKDINPEKPFTYFYLDTFFNQQYNDDRTITSLFVFFSGFSIFISFLGLFGLVAYSTLQRTKEIGVRKVLGASVENILALLSKDFLKLIGIASFVAVPLVYLGLKYWLQQYAFRMDITIWIFALPLIFIFSIAFVTVVLKSLKVATANPVDSLKYE